MIVEESDSIDYAEIFKHFRDLAKNGGYYRFIRFYNDKQFVTTIDNGEFKYEQS